MWPFGKKKKTPLTGLTLDQALVELKEFGVTLAPYATVQDLIPSLDGDPSVAVDRIDLLCVLGSEAEESRVGLLSHDIWHLDAECITDDGDYRVLAERFSMLSRGRLPLTDIIDHIDIETGKAWLEFLIKGEKIHWDLTVEDDWMDPALYSHFQKLLSLHSPSDRFMICALGQDSLILCGDEAKRKAISLFSGLDFRWE